MRGWVIAAIACLSVDPISAACQYRLLQSIPFRSTFYDLAAEGAFLWAATGYGVQLFDRSSDPPRPLRALALPGITRGIAVSGTIGYASSGNLIHILRRSSEALERVGTVDAGAEVNDLLLAGNTLHAATASGIALFDISNPVAPLSSGRLTTSSAQVLSLTSSGSLLFAADGDSSVETFSSGSAITPVSSLARASWVSATPARLFVSDGLQTEIFSIPGTPIRLATLPFGVTSATELAREIVLITGGDRRLRILDLTVSGSPADLFHAELFPNGGTVNRSRSTLLVGNRLYVAGADSGLLSFDASGFGAPFPLRQYALPPVASLIATGTAVLSGNAGAGISEWLRASSGALIAGRTWGGSQRHIVHDSAGDFLLSSSGATMTEWTLRSTTPVAVSTAVFPSAVQEAVMIGATAFALLSDGSLYTADLTQATPTPSRAPAAASFGRMARSEAGLFLTQVRTEGTTDIRFYARGDLSAAPLGANVPGIVTAIAAQDHRVAVFTFAGITVIDFAGTAPRATTIAGSNTGLIHDLAFAGDRLVEAISGGLRVRNLTRGSVERQFNLPSDALLTSTGSPSFAVAATADSLIALDLATASRQPAPFATINPNQYHRKLVLTGKWLHLFDGQAVDTYEGEPWGTPRFHSTTGGGGLIDVAGGGSRFFTLSSKGQVSAFSMQGVLLRTATIQEGTDTVPQSIAVAGGAPWVTVARGCLTTGCQKRTLVLDPDSLVQTATLEGGALDVWTSGTSAAALFDLPKETRLYDVSDPKHPALRGSRASESTAAEIVRGSDMVHVLGEKLYHYDALSLAARGETLSAAPVTLSTRMAMTTGCAFISGRQGGVEVYTVEGSAWRLETTLPISGAVRSVEAEGDRLYILDEYSLEIFSRGSATSPPRRRAAR